MKKGFRIVALLLAILMVLGVFVSAFAHAQELGEGMFVYGAGLDEEDIRITAKLLEIKDLDKVTKIRVDSKDLQKYVNEVDLDENMLSSVYVVKNKDVEGIRVKITTPKNITQVNEGQYINAAITAGVKNVDIFVGAYEPVTGTSALTGVYKAFEVSGNKLDENRVKAANDEIIVVNEINQEHKGKEGFNEDKLNKVVIEVKEKLVELKKSTGELADKAKIESLIKDSLNNNNIQNIINNINIEKLSNYFYNFQNTSAIDSKEILDQLNKFGKDLTEKAGDLFNKVKENVNTEKIQEALNSEKTKGFFKSITDFFVGIFNSIRDFFSSIVKN